MKVFIKQCLYIYCLHCKKKIYLKNQTTMSESEKSSTNKPPGLILTVLPPTMHSIAQKSPNITYI